MSGWVQVTAPSPMAYERYDSPPMASKYNITFGSYDDGAYLAPGYSARAGLGALGADPTVAKAAGSVASTAATYALAQGGGAALSAGAYASMGAAAGPIGAVVGLVVGLVVTKLLTKQYLNVAAMNAAEGDEIAVFNQYRSIAGQAAGRAYGYEAMRAVWKGALHSGLFHKNNFVQCFHQGCSAHPGNASLIDMVTQQRCADSNCFADVLPAFLASRSTSQSGKLATPVRAIQPVARSVMAPGRLRGLSGFGLVGVAPPQHVATAPVPDAVVFIDHYFIPAQARCTAKGGLGCGWAAPSSNLEHQILYDVADAYLAQQAITTTPYVAARPYVQPAGPALVPATATVSGGRIIRPLPPVPAPINPKVTPMLPPGSGVTGAGVVTTTQAATQANLDASLSSQGFTRIGTTAQGVPIYSAGGQTFLYSNGNLYPYGSVAQLAATGNAGDGAALPGTGLDPTISGIIASVLQQGGTRAQAKQAALQRLTATGVPITPEVSAQIDAATLGSPVQAGTGAWIMGAAAVGFLLFGMKSAKAAA